MSQAQSKKDSSSRRGAISYQAAFTSEKPVLVAYCHSREKDTPHSALQSPSKIVKTLLLDPWMSWLNSPTTFPLGSLDRNITAFVQHPTNPNSPGPLLARNAPHTSLSSRYEEQGHVASFLP